MRAWVVDPISYTGMAYYDAALTAALLDEHVDAVLLGAEAWPLTDPPRAPFVPIFRATTGSGPRWRRGVAYASSLARLVAKAARLHPAIVHWQYLEVPAADLAAIVALRFIGIRQLYTAHEPASWGAGRAQRVLFRLLYRVVDKVVVHGTIQRETLLRQFHVPAARIVVTEHGDYAGFATPGLGQEDARRSLGIAPVAPVVLFFGSMRPSKGLATLLRAWPSVRRRLPHAVMIIAGKPYRREDPSALLAELGPSPGGDGIVHRFEQIPPDTANTYYRAADVVVLPYDEIGTSGILRYAYSSDRCVVATAVGEHRIHVVDGVTGWLVPPRDPASLADALVNALSDRGRAERMGIDAGRYARTHFGWRESARVVAAAYAELAVGPPAPTRSGRG